MPALFCVVGFVGANWGESSPSRVWPVVYRVDRADAELVVKACEEQRDRFLKAIEPALYAITNLKVTRRVGSSKLGHDARRRREAKWRQDFAEARDREAAISAKFAGEMLDPLYPTSTNGRMPDEVSYKILEFWDDPREMGAAALMLMRARLHGGSDQDDDEPDEDL